MRQNSMHTQSLLSLLAGRVAAFLWRWRYQRHSRVSELAAVQVWQRR